MKKTPVQLNPQDFPTRLRPLLEDAQACDSSCGSGATVLFLDTGYFVKIGETGSLREEARRWAFFHRMGLGPAVIDYFSEDRDYLVTRMAQGEDMTHHLDDPQELCRILAEALRMLHSRSPAGMDPAPGLQHYLNAAASGAGCFDSHVLLKRWPIASAEEAWTIMQDNKHRLRFDTLIHGDACLPNVMVKDGQFSCFIDFSHAGLGDRHVDLYWAVWSLAFNLGTEEYTDAFLDRYGRENFEEEMLRVVAAFEAFG